MTRKGKRLAIVAALVGIFAPDIAGAMLPREEPPPLGPRGERIVRVVRVAIFLLIAMLFVMAGYVGYTHGGGGSVLAPGK